MILMIYGIYRETIRDYWQLERNECSTLTGISLSSEGASLAILNTNKYKSSERVQIKKC